MTVGGAGFAEPITPTQLEQLALYLEEDGFSVRRKVADQGSGKSPNYVINAVRGDQSYLYFLNPAESDRAISSETDSLCYADLGLSELDCLNYVSSFLSEES